MRDQRVFFFLFFHVGIVVVCGMWDAFQREIIEFPL